MERREVHYARAPDGAYLAYETAGTGAIDAIWQLDWGQTLDGRRADPVDRRWIEAVGEIFRVVSHDRRGTGASSRNVPAPTLEQRAADTLTVMDAVGMDRAVLFGPFETGAVNVLLAATRPDRVASIVWPEPSARAIWAPDYPWGSTPERVEAERRKLVDWGTIDYARWFVDDQTDSGNPSSGVDLERYARDARAWCTPDVAIEMAANWNATDVRGILPSSNVPVLLMTHGDRAADSEQTRAIASLLPDARVELMPGLEWTVEEVDAWIERIRRFVGIERQPVGLDTVLASVLFTDIVGSTERQAEMGDHAWKGLVERHHDLVRRALERWHGVERDTAGDGFFATFDGPARAVRCALEIRDHVLGLGLEVRAGVHTGECEIVDRKVGGLAVSIGSRVATTAGPSEVLVSQTVKDLVAGSGLVFADAGEHELKGVPDRWHLYRAAG